MTSRTPPRDSGKRITLTIRLPEELHERLAAVAESEYRSVNKHIVLCLERCLPPREDTAPRTHSGASLLAETRQTEEDAG